MTGGVTAEGVSCLLVATAELQGRRERDEFARDFVSIRPPICTVNSPPRLSCLETPYNVPHTSQHPSNESHSDSE